MNKILLDLLSLGAILSSVLVITSKNPVVAVIFLISLFVNAAGYLLISGITFVGLSYIIVYIGAITVLFLFIIMMINIRLLDLLEFGREYTKNFPLAIFIGSLFVFEIINILPFMFNNVLSDSLNFPLDILNQLNAMLLNIISIIRPADTNVTADVLSVTNSYLFPDFTYFSSLADNSNINSLSYELNPGFKLNNFLQIETLGQSLYTYGSIWLLICSIILLLAMISALFLSNF